MCVPSTPQYNVVGVPCRCPSGEEFYAVYCPHCDEAAENSVLMPFEFVDGKRSVFCGRWGCDALLHVRIPKKENVDE